MALYLIKYTKDDVIKFVGHLDLLKAIQRTITRAGIDIEYSKGYNPHMQMSIAQPLPVGSKSIGEYMTCGFKTELTDEELLNKLNEVTPPGVRYLTVKKVPDDMKTPMALLSSVRSKIFIPSNEKLFQEISNLVSCENPMEIKVKSKKGVESVKDLRPLILENSLEYKNGMAELTLMTKAGSLDHLSLNHVLEYIDQNTSGLDSEKFIGIERIEMFTEYEGKLISIEEYANKRYSSEQ